MYWYEKQRDPYSSSWMQFGPLAGQVFLQRDCHALLASCRSSVRFGWCPLKNQLMLATVPTLSWTLTSWQRFVAMELLLWRKLYWYQHVHLSQIFCQSAMRGCGPGCGQSWVSGCHFWRCVGSLTTDRPCDSHMICHMMHHIVPFDFSDWHGKECDTM